MMSDDEQNSDKGIGQKISDAIKLIALVVGTTVLLFTTAIVLFASGYDLAKTDQKADSITMFSMQKAATLCKNSGGLKHLTIATNRSFSPLNWFKPRQPAEIFFTSLCSENTTVMWKLNREE